MAGGKRRKRMKEKMDIFAVGFVNRNGNRSNNEGAWNVENDLFLFYNCVYSTVQGQLDIITHGPRKSHSWTIHSYTL